MCCPKDSGRGSGGERFALANRAGDSAFKEGSLPCAMVDVCWSFVGDGLLGAFIVDSC